MRLTSSVPIEVAADELFAFVSDIEQVAPCLPGARIDGREGDDYLGSMKVKVGPITVSYRGVLRFEDLDAAGRRAVMRAEADEVAGTGAANARIVTAIEHAEQGSVMLMDTELDVRGRAAQFGQGTIQRISERMIRQFAANIEARARAAAPVEATRPTAAPVDTTRPTAAPSEATRPLPAPATAEPAALDAVDLLLGPRARQWLTLGAAGLAGLVVGYLIGHGS